jgi:putative restriction endonuclease
LRGGERIPLINPQRGIFKPRQMAGLLSIRTVFPRRGGRVWYDDQREAHQQIYAGSDAVDYAFMGADPNSPDNRWLRDAMEHQTPVIYFPGTSPGRYQPIIPTFVLGWHLHARLAFGALAEASAQAMPPDAPERRYALREVKGAAAQGSFRDAVLAAYGGRCAIFRLPAQAAATRCRPHRRGRGRAARAADCPEWPATDENSSLQPLMPT